MLHKYSRSCTNTLRHLQSTEIIGKLVMDENGDPNTNYNMLHDIIENAINTHMPCKYKQKKHQWIDYSGHFNILRQAGICYVRTSGRQNRHLRLTPQCGE